MRPNVIDVECDSLIYAMHQQQTYMMQHMNQIQTQQTNIMEKTTQMQASRTNLMDNMHLIQAIHASLMRCVCHMKTSQRTMAGKIQQI